MDDEQQEQEQQSTFEQIRERIAANRAYLEGDGENAGKLAENQAALDALSTAKGTAWDTENDWAAQLTANQTTIAALSTAQTTLNGKITANQATMDALWGEVTP